MKKIISLAGIVAILLIGCSKEEDVPPVQSATAAIQQEQTAPVPVEEKKSVAWVSGRLLEISSQYDSMMRKAQDENLTFEEFRTKLHSIMTDSFIDQENLQQFYTAGNGQTELFLFHYEKGAFDARTSILEQTADRIMVKTMWFANELNSGYYENSTLVKRDDRWILDAKESEPIPEQGFELTPEEATTYMKSYPYYDKPVVSIKFVGTKTLENSSVYGQFYEFNCDGTTYYISPVDGYILGANMERF